MKTVRTDATTLHDVRRLIAPELAAATGAEDLDARLSRLGYGVRRDRRGAMLVTLPHRVDVMRLPAGALSARHATPAA